MDATLTISDITCSNVGEKGYPGIGKPVTKFKCLAVNKIKVQPDGRIALATETRGRLTAAIVWSLSYSINPRELLPRTMERPPSDCYSFSI